MRRNKTIDAEFFYGATPEIFLRAAELRRNMTLAEKILWNELSAKKLSGYTFRRQHPINNFIADFYCHKARLVIEIDGSIHEVRDHKIYDEGREDELEKFGLATIRFTNNQIMNNIESVLSKLRSECEERIAFLNDDLYQK